MKILVVGATGVIGKAVVSHLKKKHEIISAGLNNKQHPVDLADTASIHSLYQNIGPIDAVACCAGKVSFAPFIEMGSEKLQLGLQNKLLGQVQLIKIGLDFVQKGGSFTLISGILNEVPIYSGSSAALVNGAINSFIFALSNEIRDYRFNVVSPTLVQEAAHKYGSLFPGFETVKAEKVALAFEKSIEGILSGQTFRVGY